MEIEVTVRLGDAAAVKIRSDSQREVIELTSFFQQLPTACPVCQSSVQFTTRHPQGYDYYGMRCTGRPSHETTFGIHREGGGLFYKENEPWSTWQPGARQEDGETEGGSRVDFQSGRGGGARSTSAPRHAAVGTRR